MTNIIRGSNTQPNYPVLRGGAFTNQDLFASGRFATNSGGDDSKLPTIGFRVVLYLK